MGADRLVNGVAGFHKYGGPCVVVDLGTTINFDVISTDGEYLGGAIAVGIGIAIERCSARRRACRWWISAPPEDVIGTNTVASMQSGLYYGAIGMIDGILERIIDKLGPETKTVATGGQAHLIVSGSRYPQDGGRAPDARGPADDLGTEPRADRRVNYFNYFTEIEEHFQRARGTSLFLLSPLDWALIETWKNAGVPLEAVLRGIDAAFEKWRSRKRENPDGELAGLLRPGRAHRSADHGRTPQPTREETAPPFPLEDLRAYLESNAAALPPDTRRSPLRCAGWPPKSSSTTATWKSWSSA